MKSDKSQFVGAAGTFYVMSRLAYESVHASATFGNAPYIDIIASSEKGNKQISIQVKTAHFARRTTGRGTNKQWTGLDWALSYKAASLNIDNLFYAFVDLEGEYTDKKNNLWQLTVYIIPSENLSMDICKDWKEGYWRLQTSIKAMEPWKERWDLIKDRLSVPVSETVTTEQL